MEVGSLLIAETDPAVLQTLPQFLSNRLPPIDIDVATSADEAQQKLSKIRYSASVVAPKLVEGKHFACTALIAVRQSIILVGPSSD